MTKAREIAELGQKLTVDGSGNLDIAGSGTFDGLTVEDATEALITLSDTSHSNQRMKLTHSSSSGAIEVGNNGAYGNFNIKAWNGTSSISRVNINSGGDVKFFRDDGSTIHTIFDASNGFTDHRGTIKISSNQNDPNDSSAGYITNKSGWGPTVHGYRFRVNAGATGSHTNVFAVGTSLGAVFNEDSQDYDFRVESDVDANMFVVNAGTNRVGVGTNNPTGKFEIFGSNASDIMMRICNSAYSSAHTSGDNKLQFGWLNHTGASIAAYKDGTINRTGFKINTEVGFNTETERLKLGSNGSLTLTPDGSGHAVFNENGTDSDFRVESDSRTDMFFVDAANNKIGIKTTSPVKPLSLGSRTGANLSYIFGTSQTVDEDNGVFVSGSTSNTTDITYGLHLANNNSSTDAISPVIGFSALSNSDSYNHAYAYIAGFKSGQGADSNWNKGGIKFYTGAGTGPSERMRLGDRGDLILSPADNGHAVFNEGGGNSDFRVESDSNAHALFVDAGANAVCINTNSTTAQLNMYCANNGAHIRNVGMDAHSTYSFGSNAIASAKTVTVTLEEYSLRGAMFDMHLTGHYWNNGGSTYHRHTRFYLMRESTASTRINTRQDMFLGGSSTSAIGVPSASYANGVWTITYTVAAGFVHGASYHFQGPGTNRIFSISHA